MPVATEPLLPRASAAATESRALVFALGALVVGFVAGEVSFAGHTVALSGEKSLAVTAGAVAGLATIFAFASGYVRFVVSARTGQVSTGQRWRVGLDTVALTATAAIVVVLLVSTTFAVLQLAFREFALDTSTAAVVVGVVAAVAGYLVTGAASLMSTRAIANLLAMFLISGGLASMLSAQDTRWWQRNFSALGGGEGFSSYTFNITLVFAGLVIVTLTHHLTHDIRAHSATTSFRRIRALRVWLIAVGVLLTGVGVVTVNEAGTAHTVIAITMAVVFVGLVVASPFLVPWLPRSFHIMSVVVVAAFGCVVALMWPVGYFNLTAVELIASILLMTWLMLFVRSVAAAVDDDATPVAVAHSAHPSDAIAHSTHPSDAARA